MYDWKLLNGGKGLESNPRVSSQLLQPAQLNTGNLRSRDERHSRQAHRTSAMPSNAAAHGVSAPSPALVRHESKQKRPSAVPPSPSGQANPLNQGPSSRQGTAPHSHQQVATPQPEREQHPYAAAMHASAPYAQQHGTQGRQDSFAYGSGIGASGGNVRTGGPEPGVVDANGDFDGLQRGVPQQPPLTFWKLITCRCG
jgi:hypothetical protein